MPALAASAGPSVSVRAKQIDAVRTMINFNKPVEVSRGTSGSGTSSTGWSDDWKLLIYDSFCRDIVGPLMSVSELRKQGVTLHLLLEAPREKIPDVPAVYFVRPTEENVRRIVKDCADGLYDKAYINFSSPLPRTLLEKLAAGTLETDSVSVVSKLYDQHLQFVSLERDLFSLSMPRFYTSYSSPKASEAQIESAMNSVAQGLFAVLACMGTPPIIRCAPGGPAEVVARKLEAVLRDHVSGRSSVFASGAAAGSFQRPVLVLLDRNIDLAVMMGHTSTYRALLHDVLDFRLNRVTIEEETAEGGGAPRKQRKTYDLDSAADAFWSAYSGFPFPDTIAANQKELAEVIEEETRIRSTTGGGAAAGSGAAAAAGADVSLTAGTEKLASVVDRLQPLMNRKKVLQMHTHVLQAIFDELSSRHIPSFFEAEQEVLQGRANKEHVFALLTGDKGTAADKLRLACVYYLGCASAVASAELAELTAVLTGTSGDGAGAGAGAAAGAGAGAAGAGGGRDGARAAAALKFLQSIRMVTHMMAAPLAAPSSGPSSASDWTSGLLSGLDTLGAHASGLLAKAAATVKTMLPSSSQLPVTRIVDAVCDGKLHPDVDGYLTLDPKLAKGVSANPYMSASGAPINFKTAIVFTIGGGNYSEYLNLKAYASKQTPPKTVVYGSTELLNAEQFCDELCALGSA